MALHQVAVTAIARLLTAQVASRALTSATIFRADGITPRMTSGPPSTTVPPSTSRRSRDVTHAHSAGG